MNLVSSEWQSSLSIDLPNHLGLFEPIRICRTVAKSLLVNHSIPHETQPPLIVLALISQRLRVEPTLRRDPPGNPQRPPKTAG